MSVINTNVKSLVAADALRAGNNDLATAMQRLSTGKKINSAKDDAAGLAIGTRMTSQVRGLNMAIKNANDGINLAQTAEGAMTEITDMLQRMRELAVQAGNSTNTDTDRAAMNDEITQLKSEIDRVAKTTQFNNMNILDGSFAGKLQIGNNAAQTMDLAVGSVSTSAMGETANGLAANATKAKLSITSGSQNVADYQGASFDVTINGTKKTVKLPVASSSSEVIAGAQVKNISPAVQDAQIDVGSHGQVGGIAEKTVDASAMTGFTVKLGSADAVSVDISSKDYYADKTKATGAEVANALQTELDKKFKGNDKLTVSLNNGFLQIATANGSQQKITVGGTFVGLNPNAGITTDTSGKLILGAKVKDLSANTSFDVGSNHFDLSASIAAHGYNAAALTADQFVTAYNETAKVNGQQVSQVSADEHGVLTFSIADPAKPAASSNFQNGDVTSVVILTPPTAGAASTHVSDKFEQVQSTRAIGEKALTIAAGNQSLKIGLNGDKSVQLTLTAGTYSSMAAVAAEVQTQLNKVQPYSGDDAITVTATQNDDKNWGLTFSNKSGKYIELSGTFMTVAIEGAHKLEDTTKIQGSVSDNSTDHIVTVHGPEYPPSVGAKAFKQRTQDLTTPDVKVKIDGGSDIDISTNITDAIAKHATWDKTKLTGDQLVTALNEAFAANGAFAGNNAVTASLSDAGQLQLKMANHTYDGTHSPLTISGTTIDAIIAVDAASAAAAPITSDIAGNLSLVGGGGETERFGIKDLQISTANANSGLTIKVGKNGNPVDLKLSDGNYSNVDALITEINSQISKSNAFTGANALTVSKVVDKDGNEGFTIASATGDQVKVTGSLVTSALAEDLTNSPLNTGGLGETDGVTFPGVRSKIGGVDLSGNNSVSLSVTKADGSVVNQTFNLSGSNAHTSLSDYAADLQTSANQAFAGTGVSFTASYRDGKFSFSADQKSAATFSATGGAITAAFGGELSGVVDANQLDVNKFGKMSDVASAITEDLGGLGKASYDESSKTWTLETTAGDPGQSSTISVAGSGLSAVQFTAQSAVGEKGDATAARLSSVNVLTTANATAALGSIDNSIEYVSKQRSLLGAIENRLAHTVNNLTNVVTNTEASRSAIVDADYSKETTALAKQQILTQAATAMLAQANQSSQSVLSLLK